MIKTSRFFIPIPQPRHNNPRVLANGVDVTSYVAFSKWIRPVTIGIGRFELKLKDASGNFQDLFKKGDEVIFYCDNSDGSLRKFQGRIDYPKKVVSKDGQFLSIEGRHRSYLLGEVKVCFTATSTDGADILRSITSQFAPNFTTNNVTAATGSLINVSWDYVPFWECVKRICKDTGHDARVDNDLDIHLFKENSRVNKLEAISEGDNFLTTPEWGTDDFFEKSRVIVMGQDLSGFPIVVTFPEDTSNEDIREIFINDTSLDSVSKVRDRAIGEFNQLSNRPPQALLRNFYIETLEAGENIWVVIGRLKIYGLFKALTVTDMFGSDVKGVRTEVLFEKEIIGTDQLIRDRINAETRIQQADNPFKMDQSYNIDFEDSTFTETLTNVEVENGVLQLESGFTSGTFVSKLKTAAKAVTQGYLRYNATDFGASIVEVSVDNGLTFTSFSRKTLTSTVNSDVNIIIKVTLNSNTANSAPKLIGLAWLYS